MRLLTWNLDGLDKNYLDKRTEAVIQIVEKGKYDILFFQEMIPSTFDLIKNRLGSTYLSIKGSQSPYANYFVATFLRLDHVNYDSHEIVNFPQTIMNRTVLVTKVQVGGAKLCLLNTHLESLNHFTRERLLQLQQCFDISQSQPRDYTVIFGGDLNLQEHEGQNIFQGSGMRDLWEECGGGADATRFTWDLQMNTNKHFPDTTQQPRERFDRIYFRAGAGVNDKTVTPLIRSFALTGMTKVEGMDTFASDHWAIVVEFSIE